MESERRLDVGKVEVPFGAEVGSGLEVNQQHEKIFTPEDAANHSYQELLAEFFEKFARWREIFKDEQYYQGLFKNHHWQSGFRVAQTTQGLVLCTSESSEHLFSGDPKLARQDTVMYAQMRFHSNPPDEEGKYGTTMINMHFFEGAAGKQLFVDPESKPLQHIGIGIHSFWSDTWREVTISSSSYIFDSVFDYVLSSEKGQFLQRDIKFKLQDGSLQVSKIAPKRKDMVLMPENYAITLLNTLDSLIPQVNTQLPEPDVAGEQ